LFSEVPNFETPDWINLFKEPEEVIRTVGQNTFTIEPKNEKIYIDGFPVTKKVWQRVIDGEEVEVTDDDGKTVTIVKRNGDIFFNEKPFTSDTEDITNTIMENENPDMPSESGTPRRPFGNNPGTPREEPGSPGNPRKYNPNNPDGSDTPNGEPGSPGNPNNPDGSDTPYGEPGSPGNPNNPGDEEPGKPFSPNRPNTPGKLLKKKKITNS